MINSFIVLHYLGLLYYFLLKSFYYILSWHTILEKKRAVDTCKTRKIKHIYAVVATYSFKVEWSSDIHASGHLRQQKNRGRLEIEATPKMI